MSSIHSSAGNFILIQETSRPDDAEKAFALNLQGNECMKALKLNESLEKYTQAIGLFRSPFFFYNRASVYAAFKKYDDAINDCRTAIELFPNYANAYARLGLIYLKQERYDDATEAYKKAIELDPEKKSFTKELVSLEDDLKALKDDTSTLTPEVIAKANALKEEGNEYMKVSKFKEAVEKYTEAIALKRDPVYLTNRAAAYCRLKQYNDANNDCINALKLDDKYAKAYGRKGFISSCQGHYVIAVEYYKKSLEYDPNNENYKENIALAKAKAHETYQQP